MDRLFVLAAALVVAGFLSGGIYTASSNGQGFTMVVNRFNGNVVACSVAACGPVKNTN